MTGVSTEINWRSRCNSLRKRESFASAPTIPVIDSSAGLPAERSWLKVSEGARLIVCGCKWRDLVSKDFFSLQESDEHDLRSLR